MDPLSIFIVSTLSGVAGWWMGRQSGIDTGKAQCVVTAKSDEKTPPFDKLPPIPAVDCGKMITDYTAMLPSDVKEAFLNAIATKNAAQLEMAAMTVQTASPQLAACIRAMK